MSRSFHLKCLSALLLCASVLPLSLEAKGWDPLKSERSDVKKVGGDRDVEVKATRGVIMLNINRTVNIKIFSILGTLIANDVLQPGIYQFVVPAHGVYIIKAGEMTYKLAL